MSSLGGLLRRDGFLALLFALVAAAARLPRLAVPTEEVFDEVYHARTALQYLQGVSPTEWVHPPTAKLLIAAGIWAFGYDSWAWRLMPAVAGIALAPVFFLLARRVLETRRAAVLATVLLLTDGVYLVQSRIAMTNIFAVCFQVTAALLVVRAALSETLGLRAMAAAGLFIGLAVSTRWTSLWAAAYLGLVLLAVRGRRFWRPREISLSILAFAVFPAVVYLLSYVPLMRQRHRLDGLRDVRAAVVEVVHSQRDIWHYHATLNATHPYFSKWYTWPVLYRPTWYYFQSSEGWVSGIVAVGNPAIWWVSVPVTLWALATGFSARDPRRLFAGLGYCALYLPWGISPRTLNYSHYLFEAIPYACLSLGLLLDRGWDGPLRAVARAYVALTILIFILFFPILTAIPVPQSLFNWHSSGLGLWTWFRSWL